MGQHVFKPAMPQTKYQRDLDRIAWATIGRADHTKLIVVNAVQTEAHFRQQSPQTVEQIDGRESQSKA